MGGVPNSDFQHENATAGGSGENKCAMLAAMLQRHHMRLPMDMATWKANLIWKMDQSIALQPVGCTPNIPVGLQPAVENGP